jgi:hypothetical protein
MVPSLPSLPVHPLPAFGIESFGPFFGCRSAETQRMVELMGDLLDMYFVVVFADFDVGRCVRGLQNVRGDVIVLVGDECKWERGSEC